VREVIERFIISSTPAWRVMLAVGASVPFFLIILVGHAHALQSPEISRGLNTTLLACMQWMLGLATLVNMAVALFLWPRRTLPDPVPTATLLVCLSIGLSYTLVTVSAGSFTAPPSVVLIGVLVVGLLLFERQPMRVAYVLCTLVIVAYDLAVLLGHARYAPAILPEAYVGDGGLPLWWWRAWRIFVFSAGYAVILSLVFLLFSRLDGLHKQLAHLSYTDGLTGLSNRRHLIEALDAEVARQGRTRLPYCLVLIDLDHFKRVNDTHGHLQGDEVLRELGALMQRCVRSPTDLAARLGGEEFALLLPDTSLSEAQAVCERLRQALADRLFGDTGARFAVTVSMGVVESRGLSAERALREADHQLYRAKAAGRDRVCLVASVPDGSVAR
jgi:diguanylate cyclase (GGDEF)-like protein